MKFHSRRRFLLTASPAMTALGLLAATLPFSLTGSLLAEEPFAAEPQVIDNWMLNWMGGKRVSSGLLRVARFADPMYVLTAPIKWQPDSRKEYQRVTVPTGFVTDFASIPRMFWSALRPDGQYAYAAVVHDYLYWTQQQPRDKADEILKIIMEEFAVPKASVTAIYEAVHVFGGSAWDENAKLKQSGEHRILKELPKKPTMTWEEWRKKPNVFAPDSK